MTSLVSSTVFGKFISVNDKPGEMIGRYVQASAGLSQVQVVVDGQQIHGSPFSVEISPGEAYYYTSTVSGNALLFAKQNNKVNLIITMMDYFSNIRTGQFKNVQAQIDAGSGDDQMIVFQAYNRTQCNETTKVCVEMTKELFRFDPIGENGELYTVRDIGGEGQYLITYSAAIIGKVEFDLLFCNRTCCEDTECSILKNCKSKGNCEKVKCSVPGGYEINPCVPAMSNSFQRSPFSPTIVSSYSGTRARNSLASGFGVEKIGQAQYLFQTAGVQASFRIDAADQFGVSADKGGTGGRFLWENTILVQVT